MHCFGGENDLSNGETSFMHDDTLTLTTFAEDYVLGTMTYADGTPEESFALQICGEWSADEINEGDD